MTSGFSAEFKELVRSRTDIVDLINESVRLEPRHGGRLHVGLCPFHDDHNPSMQVSLERQSYKCWSCGAGGDCFSFVMEFEHLTFPETLERLATRAGLEMPRFAGRPGNSNGHNNKERLYAVLAWAEEEFHRFLLNAQEAARARDYLAERNFTEETISRFRMGYHPADWHWLQNRAREKFSPQELFNARLLRQREGDTGYYDDFRDRVLFPIRDPRGRPVAFGGRILPDHDRPDAPKYLNSPESELFQKSSVLYGFDVARDEIRKSKTVCIVEGYTDCITAHQHGITNVVGVLGTALTETHVTQLKRFARKVVLVFDGDEAGARAAERSIVKFLGHEIDLRVLSLPEGSDPSDYLEQHGTAAFQDQIEQAIEAWEYKLQVAIKTYGLDSIDARQRVLEDMLEMLSQVSGFSGTERESMLLSRLSSLTAVPEYQIRQRLQDIKKKAGGSPRREAAHEMQTRIDEAESGPRIELLHRELTKHEKAECELLEMIFAIPETVESIRVEIGPADFGNEHLRHLLQLCYDLAEQGEVPSYDRVTIALEDSELKRLALLIDERSREKEIAKKLRGTTLTMKSGASFGLLDEAIEKLKWRREEQSHEFSRGQMAQLSEASNALDSDGLALLKKASEFHKKRARQKTPH